MPAARCVKIAEMFVPDPAKDPLEQYLAATERARRAAVDTAPAALATADVDGHPSVRIVLLRGADERGFVFFTNYGSRKAQEMTANPRGHWADHHLLGQRAQLGIQLGGEHLRVSCRTELASQPAELGYQLIG